VKHYLKVKPNEFQERKNRTVIIDACSCGLRSLFPSSSLRSGGRRLFLGVPHDLERKLNMILKFVPIENDKSSQIWVFKKLAISLVALLSPASSLASLVTLLLASKTTK
jgi:hypothetical protein